MSGRGGPGHSRGVSAVLAEPDATLDPTTPAGFRQAVEAHGAALLRIAQRMLGDAHRAEDVVQEALARAYAGRDRFRREATAFSWLCGVTINVCRGELRRQRLRRWLSLDRLVDGQREPGRRRPPEAELERTEREQALHDALAQLPTKQRAALVLVSLEGRAAREAAAVLNTSEAAVWQSLSRGRARLRELLHDL